jgi:hypothetical protein
VNEMNRPQEVLCVYRELRSQLGNEFPAKELLKSAAKLVQIVHGEGPITGVKPKNTRPTFDELPVDKAMEDGGWKLLSNEPSWLREANDEDTYSVRARREIYGFRVEMAA